MLGENFSQTRSGAVQPGLYGAERSACNFMNFFEFVTLDIM